MNRKRMIIGLAMAVVVGLLASSYVYSQLKKQAIAKPLSTQNIVVAAEQLPLGTRLQPHQLRLVPWPAGEPMAGMFVRAEDCTNRALMTAVAVNEPILEAKLAPKGAGAGLAATIPEGMRALSVAVNDVVAVAGFVVPGTMVDVLVTGTTSGQNQNITRTILENVRVLAAGQKIEQDKDGKPQTVPVITLLVSPEDANRLTMGATQGRLQLALRNTIDGQKANPPPVLQASLFGLAPPPRPSARRGPSRPPSGFVVEIIVGTQREQKSFLEDGGADGK